MTDLRWAPCRRDSNFPVRIQVPPPSLTITLCLLPAFCLLASDSWFVHPERPYRMMTPQAIRAPALPAGSVFPSSSFSWITRAVPPS